jgi:hypothetical protein
VRPAILAYVVNNTLATALAAAHLAPSSTTLVVALGLAALVLFLPCAWSVVRTGRISVATRDRGDGPSRAAGGLSP